MSAMILALAILAVSMAKHRKRKRFRPYLKGQISFQQSLGTLAPLDIVSGNVVDTVSEKAWLSSVNAVWTLSQFVTGSNVGPILVGLAHSDYSSAEVEAWIESASSWQRADLVTQETNRRKIRRVGIFVQPTGVNLNAVLNEGRPIRTKCNWQLFTGDSVKIWAYNLGISALTADAEVNVDGFANLWPN